MILWGKGKHSRYCKSILYYILLYEKLYTHQLIKSCAINHIRVEYDIKNNSLIIILNKYYYTQYSLNMYDIIDIDTFRVFFYHIFICALVNIK